MYFFDQTVEHREIPLAREKQEQQRVCDECALTTRVSEPENNGNQLVLVMFVLRRGREHWPKPLLFTYIWEIILSSYTWGHVPSWMSPVFHSFISLHQNCPVHQRKSIQKNQAQHVLKFHFWRVLGFLILPGFHKISSQPTFPPRSRVPARPYEGLLKTLVSPFGRLWNPETLRLPLFPALPRIDEGLWFSASADSQAGQKSAVQLWLCTRPAKCAKIVCFFWSIFVGIILGSEEESLWTNLNSMSQEKRFHWDVSSLVKFVKVLPRKLTCNLNM